MLKWTPILTNDRAAPHGSPGQVETTAAVIGASVVLRQIMPGHAPIITSVPFDSPGLAHNWVDEHKIAQ